jgi:TolB-like protein/DNA-binding winged helix-turn-helix (wHTH) protein/tetratricopeptide (TPR) repeat protein
MEMRPAPALEINGIVADFDNEILRARSGAPVALRPQSFAVLRYLAERIDRLVTKDELMRAVWPGTAVTDDSLVQCVHEIRRALHDDNHSVLRTVPRRGYRLTLPVADGGAAPRRDWRRWGLAAAAAAALVVLAGGIVWWSLPSDPAMAGISVAVLPFDDFSGDERQSRFADAFTEDLITELSRTRALAVIARNSVETYRDQPVDVRQIARDLGVTYVLEGSLELQPDVVRVTAQLIDAGSGTHLWSERYDRPADNLFAVRDEILVRLVGTLTGYDGTLWTEWNEATRRRPPGSLQAFDYYLLAREPYRRHDGTGNAEARRLLEQALELDPLLARAWDFLAHAHMQDAINGWTGDRTRSWQLYREAAQRAAELDPADGNIQMQLGVMHFERGETELGAQAWERALDLAPNDALVNRAIGTQLPIALGTERAEDGVRLVERALTELDPLHPPFQWISLGIPLYFAGRFPEAVTAFRKVPDPWLEVRVMLALSLAEAGRTPEAETEAAAVLGLDPAFSAESWIANDIYQPGGSSALLIVASAGKAGLPVCAAEAAAAAIPPGERLAECEALRSAGR